MSQATLGSPLGRAGGTVRSVSAGFRRNARMWKAEALILESPNRGLSDSRSPGRLYTRARTPLTPAPGLGRRPRQNKANKALSLGQS